MLFPTSTMSERNIKFLLWFLYSALPHPCPHLYIFGIFLSLWDFEFQTSLPQKEWIFMCFRGYIISNWQPDLYLANQEAASGINFCVEYADRTDARDEYMEAKKRVERGEEAKSWQWWQTGALLWGNAWDVASLYTAPARWLPRRTGLYASWAQGALAKLSMASWHCPIDMKQQYHTLSQQHWRQWAP